METLKVNKSVGRTYRTGTQVAQALVVRSYYFFYYLYANVQFVKHEHEHGIVSYRRHLLHYTTTEFQYAKRDTRLSIQHIEVLALRSVIFITKISKFLLKCLLTFFSIHNTSIHGALEGERPYWWDCFNCEKKSLLKNSTTKERKDSLT